jgi:hypothetical protein
MEYSIEVFNQWVRVNTKTLEILSISPEYNPPENLQLNEVYMKLGDFINEFAGKIDFYNFLRNNRLLPTSFGEEEGYETDCDYDEEYDPDADSEEYNPEEDY